MALLNYTTNKNSEETIGEIQKMLSNHGVTAMMTEYDGKNVSAVSFRMNINGEPRGYKLPCNWRAVFEVLKNDPAARRRGRVDEDRAIKVAWRVIKDWMEAQLALVAINMVTIPQIFLPYTIMKGGKTLAEKIDEDPRFLLGNGE
jgi:hypothetical protein